jgi:mono/diheme cytochrome c family protein
MLMPATTVLAGGSAISQRNPDIQTRGYELAKTWCSGCHLVEPGQTVVRELGPTFKSIASMKSTTSLSLHVFLQTPHTLMPDWRLSNEEIDDVVAYILSMRPESS